MTTPAPVLTAEIRKQVSAIRKAKCVCRLTRKSKVGDVVLVDSRGETGVYYVISWLDHAEHRAVMLRNQEGYLFELLLNKKGKLIV